MADDPVDVAIKYLDSIQAKYLCKEDKIIWYGSQTNRKSDSKWHTLTLDQIRRIISYRFSPVGTKDIIKALQELDVVFDTALHTPYATPKNIFNKRILQDSGEVDEVVRCMFENLTLQHLMAKQYTQVIKDVCETFKIKSDPKLRATAIRKYAPHYGYKLHEGKQRLKYKRCLTTVLAKEGTTGHDLFDMRKEQIDNLITFTIASDTL